jgi:hypothetical protein
MTVRAEVQTLDEIKATIQEVAALRMPDFEAVEAHDKIEMLEDYLLETARARHVLEQARLILEDAYEEIDDKWRAVEGFEVYLRGRPKTTQEIDEAKRQVNPDLFYSRRRCIKLLRQLGNQNRRMERDDAACSRAYTMLTGS